MEDPKEEFEPLFDYSRVQPIDFVSLDDDDNVDSPAFFPDAKRKRCLNPAGNGKENSKVVTLEDDKGKEEEEDWLPPPPTNIHGTCLALEEDKTIQELRLKKQELASFTQSAKDAMRAVMESTKRELNSSGKSDLEPETKEPSVPKVERQKILISIQDKDGNKQFRMYKDDTFKRLFKMYAEKVKSNLESLVFIFDGDKVSPTATPDSLGLEDDDMIEVHFKSH